MTIQRARQHPVEGIAGTEGLSPGKVVLPPPARRSRWRGRAVLVVLLGGAAGLGYVYRGELKGMLWGRGTASQQVNGQQVYTVRRGTLNVAITEEGKLRAMKNHLVTLEVNGKIASLAAAGDKVKKGDLLVTIDKKPFEDQLRTVTGDLETAKQTLVIAEKAIPIAVSKAESELAAANTKRDEAALALKLYTTLEVPKKLNEFETQINDMRSKMQEAQKKRGEYQAQLDEHLEDDDVKKGLQQQVEYSKQTVASFQKTLATYEEQRKLFRAYSYPQDLKSKKQALANADLEVTKVKTSAENELVQKKAEVRKAQELIARLTREVARLNDMIAKCRVCSPADGLVFYGSADSDRSYMNDQIRVGSEWYQNYPIMTIPDLSSFRIDMQLPEVYRGRVAIGQPARVVLEAIPGLTLNGKISKLASVARGRVPWDPSSPQIFDTTIALSGVDSRMVAGMSSKVEITTATYERVLFVPVEAVFNEDGKPAVYRVREKGDPERVAVRAGASNDHFVLIADGLEEGDKVLLSRPGSFYVAPDFLAKSLAVALTTLPAPASQPAVTDAATEAATTSAPSASQPDEP